MGSCPIWIVEINFIFIDFLKILWLRVEIYANAPHDFELKIYVAPDDLFVRLHHCEYLFILIIRYDVVFAILNGLMVYYFHWWMFWALWCLTQTNTESLNIPSLYWRMMFKSWYLRNIWYQIINDNIGLHSIGVW